MYDYNAVITNVVDGDTYDVDIDLGFHIHIHERIRVLNLDTPECRGPEKKYGNLCKAYAEKFFLNKKIRLYSEEEIKAPQTDSFGRWLCRIYVIDFNDSIYSIFTSLGCNKYHDGYSEYNVERLADFNAEKIINIE